MTLYESSNKNNTMYHWKHLQPLSNLDKYVYRRSSSPIPFRDVRETIHTEFLSYDAWKFHLLMTPNKIKVRGVTKAPLGIISGHIIFTQKNDDIGIKTSNGNKKLTNFPDKKTNSMIEIEEQVKYCKRCLEHDVVEKKQMETETSTKTKRYVGDEVIETLSRFNLEEGHEKTNDSDLCFPRSSSSRIPVRKYDVITYYPQIW